MTVLDTLNRPLRALRVSVTDRCNFRCPYCMPREKFGEGFAFLDRKEILTFEEIIRLVGLFVAAGVAKVRLTGGEPTLRHGLPDLIERLAAVPGLRELAMTTNGSTLEAQAADLRRAGLHRLTVSLDSLRPERFAAGTDGAVPVDRVLAGLRAARRAGFTAVKVNCVLRRGVNDDEILELAAFAREEGLHLRFIEYMDAGGGHDWRLDSVVPALEVVRTLAGRWPLEEVPCRGPGGVARHWRYLDGAGVVGTIASVTQPFCAGCDRARLSAAGSLYTCLFADQGTDLKGPLRAGRSDQELAAILAARWSCRDDRYSECRTEATAALPRVPMSHIGG